MQQFYLGIDLGGSNISAAIMNSAGKISIFKKIPTLAQEGPRQIVRRMAVLTGQIAQEVKIPEKNIPSIGIGVPGVIDIRAGMVRYSPNLPGWKNIALRRELQQLLGKTIHIDNDANLAALGEKWMGRGKHFDHVVMYTLGTGVGGGIIIDGKILHGASDGAGELGHMTILINGPRCNCGNHGCLEALASGTAIAREGQRLAAAFPRSLLALSAKKQGTLTAKTVVEAARFGDMHALALIQKTGVYLGIAVATIINLYNPQMVIIGGGVSLAGELLLRSIRQEAKRRAMKDLYKDVKIVKAQLSDRAGVYGAVALALQANHRPVRKADKRT